VSFQKAEIELAALLVNNKHEKIRVEEVQEDLS